MMWVFRPNHDADRLECLCAFMLINIWFLMVLFSLELKYFFSLELKYFFTMMYLFSYLFSRVVHIWLIFEARKRSVNFFFFW